MNNHITRRSLRRPLQSNSMLNDRRYVEDDIPEVADDTQCDGAPLSNDKDSKNCKPEVKKLYELIFDLTRINKNCIYCGFCDKEVNFINCIFAIINRSRGARLTV